MFFLVRGPLVLKNSQSWSQTSSFVFLCFFLEVSFFSSKIGWFSLRPRDLTSTNDYKGVVHSYWHVLFFGFWTSQYIFLGFCLWFFTSPDFSRLSPSNWAVGCQGSPLWSLCEDPQTENSQSLFLDKCPFSAWFQRRPFSRYEWKIGNERVFRCDPCADRQEDRRWKEDGRWRTHLDLMKISKFIRSEGG